MSCVFFGGLWRIGQCCLATMQIFMVIVVEQAVEQFIMFYMCCDHGVARHARIRMVQNMCPMSMAWVVALFKGAHLWVVQYVVLQMRCIKLTCIVELTHIMHGMIADVIEQRHDFIGWNAQYHGATQ